MIVEYSLLTDKTFVMLTCVLIAVALAALFIRHLQAYVEVASEANVYHQLSITDQAHFQALKARGVVIEGATIARAKRWLVISTVLNTAFWSLLMGYCVALSLGMN